MKPEDKNLHEATDSKLNMAEMIASTLLFGFGALTMARGMYWATNSHSADESEMYQSLSYVMPLWGWAIGFLIGGLLLMLSSWNLPKRHIRKRFAGTLFSGGLISSASYFIVAIAGIGNAINWLTPIQLVIFSAIGLIIAFYGGVLLWHQKTTKNMY